MSLTREMIDNLMSATIIRTPSGLSRVEIYKNDILVNYQELISELSSKAYTIETQTTDNPVFSAIRYLSTQSVRPVLAVIDCNGKYEDVKKESGISNFVIPNALFENMSVSFILGYLLSRKIQTEHIQIKLVPIEATEEELTTISRISSAFLIVNELMAKMRFSMSEAIAYLIWKEAILDEDLSLFVSSEEELNEIKKIVTTYNKKAPKTKEVLSGNN